ncbi:putative Glutathione-dependent formaldehyde-activating, GFA protein [Vibrio nigripulchritudo SO65]|uniref:GFA family protein n=1 Tax=Vibrio nigripulchritudo TaxID=28173 RepID=UPI0003B1EB7F|nr:GFA family protein [Vibrio nigripulchritudo]CCN34327.1 putative Glutathione-dependent formaldehyde-activating, GFA protein [Vibrio nigripulchritudo AM115]CCN43932.1 putative Glutathione-dependent formaldehyde-activating, GFA protein [Vibrio nigripulchritudo FTn2]CCN62788.1 putative Glutathione-dependent formaldehyde-activating, GFA protein [Vibrio nigripulchritudo POn4]CCN79578.1 putative Glutathione-dependent formaldehyde-activating, GFA protein [Vibrio nigripulchritudo SO65]
MNETFESSGSCVCGAVTFHAKTVSPSVGTCHCHTCRRWSGGPLMSVDCGSNIQFEGEDNIQVYDSSDWAERGFCKRCGSHLFYRIKHNQQHIVGAGLIDDQSKFVFDHQVFTDERPHYYQFANQTHDMTGPEVFAEYGGN